MVDRLDTGKPSTGDSVFSWPKVLLELLFAWVVISSALVVVAIGEVVAALWWVVQAPSRLSAWATRRMVR